MQTCYNCGKQVPDTTLICPECGALVRRYTDAPKREPEPQQRNPDQRPPQQQNPYQQNPYQQPPYQQNPYQQNPYQQNPYQQPPFQQNPYQQPLDPNGVPQKVRLYGPVRVWLILLCVICAYMAFSSLMTVALALNPAVLDNMLSEPGMEAMAPMVGTLREVLSQPFALPLFILMLLFYSAKFACHLWLLLSGRRLPFRISIGVSLAGLLGMLLLGGNLLSILFCLDPIFTWLGLRRFWPWMQK